MFAEIFVSILMALLMMSLIGCVVFCLCRFRQRPAVVTGAGGFIMAAVATPNKVRTVKPSDNNI